MMGLSDRMGNTKFICSWAYAQEQFLFWILQILEAPKIKMLSSYFTFLDYKTTIGIDQKLRQMRPTPDTSKLKDKSKPPNLDKYYNL